MLETYRRHVHGDRAFGFIKPCDTTHCTAMALCDTKWISSYNEYEKCVAGKEILMTSLEFKWYSSLSLVLVLVLFSFCHFCYRKMAIVLHPTKLREMQQRQRQNRKENIDLI